MHSQPLFPNNIISSYLTDFSLSSISNTRKITNQIKELQLECESGKLASLKEEEMKSRFVSTFFGDVLGYNYGNSTKWLLREEKKSVTDATKSDGALGYFFIDKTKDDVRAVVSSPKIRTIC